MSMNRFPQIKEFCEFELSHDEMETILQTMKSESMFSIDAKRYEEAQVRYSDRLERMSK